MKKAALILTVLGLLIFIALGAYLYLSRSLSQTPVPASPQGNPFGFSINPSSGETLALTTDTGETVYVNDFTKTEQPDWAGPDSGYNVAGNGSGAFAITYYPANPDGGQGQFSIALLKEPLGENRLRATEALRERTGLGDATLCALDVEVFTSIHVNETYAGYDLGLDTCPNATLLP